MVTSQLPIQVSSFTLVAGSSSMSKTHPFLIFIYSNNSIEVNLLECAEKDSFNFEKLETAQSTETESAAGRIAATLQQKTIKLLQRRR